MIQPSAGLRNDHVSRYPLSPRHTRAVLCRSYRHALADAWADISVVARTVSYIDTEDKRKAIQTALIAAGFDVGLSGVDGVLGTNSAKALIAFKASKGLPPDAVVDTNVMRELGLLAIQSPIVVAAARSKGLDILSLLRLIGPIDSLLKGTPMTSDQITGILRAILTALGGYFVTRGWLSSDTVNEVIGAVLTLGGAAWSIWSNRPKTILPISQK